MVMTIEQLRALVEWLEFVPGDEVVNLEDNQVTLSSGTQGQWIDGQWQKL